MSVDEPERIDVAGIDRVTGEAILTVSDHREWDDEETHLEALEEKLNSYLRFAESGEIVRKYPAAAGKHIIFRVVGLHPLSERAKEFYIAAGAVIERAGFRLEFELSEPTPDRG